MSAMSAETYYADKNKLDNILHAGSTFMMTLNFDKAVNCYTKVLQMIEVSKINAITEDELVIIKYALAHCYVAVGESENAIDCICSITELELYLIKYPILYLPLVIALIEEKYFDLAETVIKKGLKELKNITYRSSSKPTWPGSSSEIPESIEKTLVLRLTSLKEICLKMNNFEKTNNKTYSLRVDATEFVPPNFETLTKDKEFTQKKECNKIFQLEACESSKRNLKDVADEQYSICLKSNRENKESDQSSQFEVDEETSKDLVKVYGKLKAENEKLKASIKDYQNDITELNKKVSTLTISSQSMAATLTTKERYIGTLQDDIDNLVKRLTSGVRDNEHLVTEIDKLDCNLSVIVTSLTTVHKENFDSHLLKCKTMINDLEKALTVLSKTTTPTHKTCFQQLQSWESELIKTQQCLTHLTIFSTSLSDQSRIRKWNTLLAVPSEFVKIKDLGSCLHENYYACVSNLTKTISEQEEKNIKLEIANRKLALAVKQQQEPFMFTPNSSANFGTSTPINLTFDTQASPSVNNKPFKSLNECSEPSNPLFDLSLMLLKNLDSSKSLRSLQIDSNAPITLKRPLGLSQNVKETKAILQNKKNELCSSKSSLEVLNSQPELSYDPKASNCLFLNGTKFQALLQFIKSKIPYVNDNVLLFTVYAVRQRCGKFSGKSKECIVNLVNEELQKKFENNSCCICLEFYQFLPTTMLPCMHTFHRECIKVWLTNNSPDCPVCRAHVIFEEKYF